MGYHVSVIPSVLQANVGAGFTVGVIPYLLLKWGELIHLWFGLLLFPARALSLDYWVE
jgi:hypothetical protein